MNRITNIKGNRIKELEVHIKNIGTAKTDIAAINAKLGNDTVMLAEITQTYQDKKTSAQARLTAARTKIVQLKNLIDIDADYTAEEKAEYQAAVTSEV